MVSPNGCFHPKGKARKTVKTHCIASALSALRLGIDWRLSLSLPLSPLFLSDCPWAVPVPKVTWDQAASPGRETQGGRETTCWANRNWPNELERPRYGHKQCWVRSSRRRMEKSRSRGQSRKRSSSCNHLNANELCKLNNSELAAKCKLCTIWPNKLCNFIYKHRLSYMHIYAYIFAIYLCISLLSV